MSMTELLRESLSLPALTGGLLPISVNGQTNTGTIDMKLFNRATFLISLGLGVATGNIVLQAGNNADGSSATTIAGCNIAYTANSKVYAVECRSDQISFYRYVKANIITDGACLVSAVGIGAIPRYSPANAYYNASVGTRAAANT